MMLLAACLAGEMLPDRYNSGVYVECTYIICVLYLCSGERLVQPKNVHSMCVALSLPHQAERYT